MRTRTTFPRERLKVHRMDCDLAVWVLCNQAKRARHKDDVPAGTFEGAQWQPQGESLP